jgi:MoaA/NifB/PqqE/SkfB family radical SAM enzyme
MKEELNLQDYSFCLFRLPPEGGRVLWEITNSCNYSCGYCIFSAEKGDIPGELTTDESFNVLDGLKTNNFSHIKFTGGEPFHRKDFITILKKSKNLDFIVDVSTNASLINKAKAQAIAELDLNMVHISVDGYNQQIHELARGKNTYQPTLNGLRNLIDNNVYTRVGSVIFKGNEGYLEEMVDSMAHLGANEVIFSFMEPVGRMKGDDTVISTKSIHEVKGEIEELAKRYNNQIKVSYSFTEQGNQSDTGICPAVDKFLYIDNLGRISPCTWVVEKNQGYRSELTLKDSTLKEVIDSEPIQSYLHDKKGILGCPARMR